MARRTDASDWLEWFGWRTEGFLARRLSRGWVRRIGRLLGRIGYFLWRKRRQITIKNLARVYSSEETKPLALKCWQNWGETFAESFRLPRLAAETEEWISWAGEEFLEQALRKGRGVILLCAHFCRWELLGAVLARRYPLCVIAKHIQNPWVDKWVEKMRKDCGLGIIYIQESIKEGLKCLGHGYLLGILIDQKIHRGGLAVNFLGSRALTTPLIPLLAKRSRAPVIPVFIIKEGNHYRVIFEKELVFDSRQALEIRTRQCNEVIEKWILHYPEQWFWMHNRWKR